MLIVLALGVTAAQYGHYYPKDIFHDIGVKMMFPR